MYKRLLLLLFCLTYNALAWAQDSTVVTPPVRKHRPFPPRPPHRDPRPKPDNGYAIPYHNLDEIHAKNGVVPPDYRLGVLIGTNPTSLVEIEGGPSLAVEYRFARSWAVGVTATDLLYDFRGIDDKSRKVGISGYRLTPDIKFFLPGKRKTYHMFFGLQGLYKQEDYQYFLERDEELLPSGEPTPQGFYRRTKYIWGGAATFGVQRYLDKAQHFQVELLGGIGARQRYQDFHGVGKPSKHGDKYENSGILGPDNGGAPQLAFSVRLAWRL